MFLQDLAVVTALHSEYAVVDDVFAVEVLHLALQGQPQREPRQNLQQNGAQTPDVEHVSHLREVRDAVVQLRAEPATQECLNLGRQVLRRAHRELPLVFELLSVLSEQKGRSEVYYLQ